MKLYIIPAYEETIRNKGYGKIIRVAKTKGYSVEVLNLQIQGSKFEDIIKEGIRQIEKSSDKKRVIMGFSTGALIAYKISTRIKFNVGLFCSISPLLKNDIPNTAAPYIKFFGKKTVDSLKRSTYGTSLASKTFFFVGDNEGKKLPKRTNQLSKINNGEVITIKNNDHELDTNYIHKIVEKL